VRQGLLPAFSSVIAVAAGLGLLAWNSSRFIGAESRIRTKDLTFLPSPAVAKVLSLGHWNSFAKLRWIDSFAYFEKQLETKDDTIPGTGESAYERLYVMLLALDPKFLPYYQQGSLALSGVLSRHHVALGLLKGGLLELPHETQLWRMIAAELATNFKGEKGNAALMDAFLAAWSDAETTDAGRGQVWDWKKAMGRRQFQELEQVPYWIEQLRNAKPDSPTAAFILRTLREQLARFGENRLQRLVDVYRATYFMPPVFISDVVKPDLVARAFPHGMPEIGPLSGRGGTLMLKPDPFGFPYELVNGKPQSPGWQQVHAGLRTGLMSQRLAEIAKRDGRWPTTITEAITAGLNLEVLPTGGEWVITGQVISVTWRPAPSAAWTP